MTEGGELRVLQLAFARVRQLSGSVVAEDLAPAVESLLDLEEEIFCIGFNNLDYSLRQRIHNLSNRFADLTDVTMDSSSADFQGEVDAIAETMARKARLDDMTSGGSFRTVSGRFLEMAAVSLARTLGQTLPGDNRATVEGSLSNAGFALTSLKSEIDQIGATVFAEGTRSLETYIDESTSDPFAEIDRDGRFDLLRRMSRSIEAYKFGSDDPQWYRSQRSFVWSLSSYRDSRATKKARSANDFYIPNDDRASIVRPHRRPAHPRAIR